MSRRLVALALPLGFLCALALAACGSDNSKESGTTLTPPPISSGTTASTATVPTTTATTPTSTAPATTTTTAPSGARTTTQPATGGATTTQPSGGAPGSCPNAVGGFIRNLHGSDCGVARTVASAWFDAVHGGAAPDGTITAAGYSCTSTLAGERASVTCSGSGDTVAFTASP
ncbi:MAG: hypothetical protein ACTHOE_14290 [Conexibacter sp.]